MWRILLNIFRHKIIMKSAKIVILGGTGFVGRHLASSLIQNGCKLKLLSRYPHRHREIVSREIEIIAADIYDQEQLCKHFQGTDAVINLVGMLNDSAKDGSGFRRTHVELPNKIVDACKQAGVKRLLHMSALKAGDPQALSYYLRTKGEGENLVHTAAGNELIVTSFRPSVIFGHGDNFLNRFAALLTILPIMPLACSETRFAPVYIGDVVKVFIKTLETNLADGKRYNLCGPKIYTLHEIVNYVATLLEIKRVIIPLNEKYSQTQAKIMGLLPWKPFSMDNYLSLQIDSICQNEHLLPFAITPTPLEVIAPYYLGKSSQRARYSQLRATTEQNQ